MITENCGLKYASLCYALDMAAFPSGFKHWLAGIFLGVAVVMLVLGMTVLSSWLVQMRFVVYWSLCFVFTGLAGMAALSEMSAIRHDSREAQKELIEETLSQVEADKRRSQDAGY